MQKEIAEYAYTAEEVAELLGLKMSTLMLRLYRRSNCPPFQKLGRGFYVFPKELFMEWLRRQPVSFEVKDAG